MRITAALTAGVMLFGMALPAFAAQDATRTENSAVQAVENAATPETASETASQESEEQDSAAQDPAAQGAAGQENAAQDAATQETADAGQEKAERVSSAALSLPQKSAAAELPAYIEGEAIVCVRGGVEALLDGAAENGRAGYALTFTAEELMNVPTAVAVETVEGQASADEPSLMSLDAEDEQATLLLVQSGMDTDALIAALEQNGNVLFAEPNYTVTYASAPSDPYYPYQHGYENTINDAAKVAGNPSRQEAESLHIETVWDAPDKTNEPSKNPVVAVVDSGVDYTHPDLVNVMWNDGEKYDALTALGGGAHGLNLIPEEDSRYPMDLEAGHGTHCASVIASQWNNDEGGGSAAQNARIMAVRILGGSGGTMAGILRGFRYIQTAKEQGVNVVAVNNSWGPSDSDAAMIHSLDTVVKALGQQGIITLFAAGNNTSDLTLNPNMVRTGPTLLTVGAVDSTGGAADFSSYSERYVDVFAPGVQILAATSQYGDSTMVVPRMYLPQMQSADNYYYEDFEEQDPAIKLTQVIMEQTGEEEGDERWKLVEELSSPRQTAAGYSSARSAGVALEVGEEDPILCVKMEMDGSALVDYKEGDPLCLAFQTGLDGLRMFQVVGQILYWDLEDDCWRPVCAENSDPDVDGSSEPTWMSDRNWNELTLTLDETTRSKIKKQQELEGKIELVMVYFALGTGVFDFVPATGEPQVRIDDFGFGKAAVPYSYADGTSMACPMVAGLAALLSGKLDEDGMQDASDAAEVVARIKGAVTRDVPNLEWRSVSMGRVNAALTLEGDELVPVLDSLSVAGTTATLNGHFFGTAQGTLKLDDVVVPAGNILAWGNESIQFTLPADAAGLREVTVVGADQSETLDRTGRGFFTIETADAGDMVNFQRQPAPNDLIVDEVSGYPLSATSLYAGRLVAANEKMYLTAVTAEMEKSFLACYDMAAKTWTLLENPEGAEPTTLFRLAAGKDQIYLLYERASTDPTAAQDTETWLAVLDTGTNQWVHYTKIEDGDDEQTLAVYNDQLLLVGGYQIELDEHGKPVEDAWGRRNQIPLNTVKIIDPATGRELGRLPDMLPAEKPVSHQWLWANASGDLLVVYDKNTHEFQYYDGSKWTMPPKKESPLWKNSGLIVSDQTVDVSLTATDEGIWAVGPVSKDGKVDTWLFDTNTQTWTARTDYRYSANKTIENIGGCYDGAMYVLSFRAAPQNELIFRSTAVKYTGPTKNPVGPEPTPTPTPTATPEPTVTPTATPAPTQKPGGDPTAQPTAAPTVVPAAVSTPAAGVYARTATIPATGDESAPAALVVLVLLSGLSLGGLWCLRSKKK